MSTREYTGHTNEAMIRGEKLLPRMKSDLVRSYDLARRAAPSAAADENADEVAASTGVHCHWFQVSKNI